MTVAIIILGIVSMFGALIRIVRFEFDVPEPFACGSDEVCHCDESKDCKKKR
tara:strand:+ start:453 stop:608 length:156 start_codon:yes stop_codon:yes gene_type:complete